LANQVLRFIKPEVLIINTAGQCSGTHNELVNHDSVR